MSEQQKEILCIKGSWELELRDASGKVKEIRRVKNLVVNVGKAYLAGLLNGLLTTPFKYIAIGTSNAAPAATDTGLGNEIGTAGGSRALGTISRVTTTVTDDTARIQIVFTFTGALVIQEAGLFNSAAGPTMFNRATFAVINAVATETLQVTVDVQMV